MILNKLFEVKCSRCKTYKNIHTEIYLPDGCENEGRVCCLECNAILGYTWDKFWIDYWSER